MPSEGPRRNPWSKVSLACGALGWLVGLPLPFLDYGRIIGSTAGVGLVGPLFVGLLSAVLCLLAVVFGAVALVQGKREPSRGRWMAWTGLLGGVLGLGLVVLASAKSFGLW